ncbi:hypothetical protein NQ318_015291, partial [Aromia moschata]
MLHPYHYPLVQQILPQDLPARLQFAQFLQNMETENPDFLNKTLFTDETTFTRRGVFTWRNDHLWDSENPHAVKEHFQHEFRVNIWCGVISNVFIGPFELPPSLTGPRYLNFPQHNLNELLVLLALRENMWFMPDGVPPHLALPERQYLHVHFPYRWIGRGSEFELRQRIQEAANPFKNKEVKIKILPA